MPKKPSQTEKTIYRISREQNGYSREAASMLTGIEVSKIERIENEKITSISPYDVVAMAEAYKAPMLCNYFCSNECPIGIKYVPEVKIEDLKEITLEMLASLSELEDKKSRILQIVRDGKIDDEELEDFVEIQNELEQISMIVEALQIWSERMLAEGKIDKKKYNSLIKK